MSTRSRQVHSTPRRRGCPRAAAGDGGARAAAVGVALPVVALARRPPTRRLPHTCRARSSAARA